MDAPSSSGAIATAFATASCASFPVHHSTTSVAVPSHPQNAPVAVMDEPYISDDRTRRAASVLSMDDLEAAQALEGLRSGMSLDYQGLKVCAYRSARLLILSYR